HRPEAVRAVVGPAPLQGRHREVRVQARRRVECRARRRGRKPARVPWRQPRRRGAGADLPDLRVPGSPGARGAADRDLRAIRRQDQNHGPDRVPVGHGPRRHGRVGHAVGSRRVDGEARRAARRDEVGQMTRNPADAYIAAAPKAAQPHLRQLRAALKEAAPKAEERISYGIVGYFYPTRVVYFGGHAKHVALYPAGDAKGLEKYLYGASTLRFPLDEPLPIARIKSLV